MRKQQSAFTLAEVLITLGIIGVVAAMTLPTLIQNHQKQTYVTGIQKGISTISNAFSKMQADENASTIATTSLFSDALCAAQGTWDSDGFTNENGCEEMYGNPSVIQQIIPKYLKVVKTCIGNDCDIKYKEHWSLSYANNKYTLPTSNDTGSKIQNNSYFGFGTVTGFYTTDGMIYYLVPTENSITVGIDTNGEKGPNEWGRDFFPMLYCSNNGGKLISQIDADGYCRTDPWEEQMTPLKYLMSNGWKMDY